MSIARVKIAPVERWCEFAQGYLSECPGFERVAGATIPIDSVSMQVRPADFYHKSEFRTWDLGAEALDEIARAVGMQLEGEWICEHMLEMD